ncbi:MAG: ABC transporter ATP-binding protein [Gemmatimonadaceae bacterium]
MRQSRTELRPGEAALAIERLVVPFGAGPGLTDVSLTVGKGERVAVVGPSGVGKTTLLRAIAGLAPITAGRVRVGGRDVTALKPEERDAVYLHQSPVLFSHLTVAENVAFPLRVRGRRGRDVQQRVHEALGAVRLESFGPRAVRTLSGGQRHRVALARSIAARPAALLLDEPLSALDPSLRDEVRSAIVAAQNEYEPGALLVTHDLDDAGLLADRIAVLLDGGIAQVAPPAELFARPQSLAVARFLGIFQEMEGCAGEDGEVACALGILAAGQRVPQGPVAVVFRPDAIRIGPVRPGAPAARVVAVRQRVRSTSLVLHVGENANSARVEATVLPGGAVAAVGAEVGVVIDPDGVLMFPT